MTHFQAQPACQSASRPCEASYSRLMKATTLTLLALAALSGCGAFPRTIADMKQTASRRISYPVDVPLPKLYDAIHAAQRACHESPGLMYIDPGVKIIGVPSEDKRSADVAVVMYNVPANGVTRVMQSFVLTAESAAVTRVEVLDNVLINYGAEAVRIERSKARVSAWLVGDTRDCGMT